MSDKQLHTEKDSKMGGTGRQQLAALLHSALKSKTRGSLYVAGTCRAARREGRRAQMIEKETPIVIDPLFSDLQVPIDKVMRDQV